MQAVVSPSAKIVSTAPSIANLEKLETRRLLTGGGGEIVATTPPQDGPGAVVVDGTLIVTGHPSEPNEIVVEYDSAAEAGVVRRGDETLLMFFRPSVETITVHGGSDADMVEIRIDRPAEVFGYAGADTLVGDAGNDRLFGGEGNDSLRGNAGDDWLDGQAGADILDGGAGRDTVDYSGRSAPISVTVGAGGTHTDSGVLGDDGEAGEHDRISPYVEVIRGTASDDLINLRGYRYTTTSSTSPAELHHQRPAALGGAGNDTLVGAGGGSHLHGGPGNDVLQSESAREGETLTRLFGGEGHDWLEAGNGHDILSGGDGEDVLIAGGGRATFHGGADNDRFDIESTGRVILDFRDQSAAIRLDLSAGELETADGDTLEGLARATVVLGSDFADTLVGGPGHDLLKGEGGDDQISGGEGNDALEGGRGNDVLDGGEGNDLLRSDILWTPYPYDSGNSGHDTLRGGIGDDTLDGGGRNDLIDGGEGTDTVSYASHHRSVMIRLDGAPSGAIADDTVDIVHGLMLDRVEVARRDAQTDAAVPELPLIEKDRIENVENAHGSPSDDVIVGNAGPNFLLGGHGRDTLFGLAGKDKLDGGLGDRDVLAGGTDFDLLIDTKTYPEPTPQRFYAHDVLLGGGGTDASVLYAEYQPNQWSFIERRVRDFPYLDPNYRPAGSGGSGRRGGFESGGSGSVIRIRNPGGWDNPVW